MIKTHTRRLAKHLSRGIQDFRYLEKKKKVNTAWPKSPNLMRLTALFIPPFFCSARVLQRLVYHRRSQTLVKTPLMHIFWSFFVDKGFFFSLFVFVSRCGEPPHCQVKRSLPDMEDDKLIGAAAFQKERTLPEGLSPHEDSSFLFFVFILFLLLRCSVSWEIQNQRMRVTHKQIRWRFRGWSSIAQYFPLISFLYFKKKRIKSCTSSSRTWAIKSHELETDGRLCRPFLISHSLTNQKEEDAAQRLETQTGGSSVGSWFSQTKQVAVCCLQVCEKCREPPEREQLVSWNLFCVKS